MKKVLENELTRIKQIEDQIKKTIKNAPEGKVRCSSCRGSFQYYQGREYISKDKIGYIKRIAQRDYCRSMEGLVKKVRSNLETLMKVYNNEELEQAYRKLPSARKAVVTPLIKPIEDIVKEFEQIQYEGLGFSEKDTREFYTIKGERVRSKSEKIIADELYRKGIPYKYELPINVVDYRGREKTIYPDFTVLNKRTGKKWIVEHFGLMDGPEYYDKSMWKLDTFERNGYYLGVNLLIFHETDRIPLNIKVMQNYIEYYLE